MKFKENRSKGSGDVERKIEGGLAKTYFIAELDTAMGLGHIEEGTSHDLES